MKQVRISLVLAAFVGFPTTAQARLSNAEIICRVAHNYQLSCSGMIRVAQCESTLNRWATNGQYLGLFQLGGFARSKFLRGNWYNPWKNSEAAARYARWAGGWSPWTCGYNY